MALGTGPIVQIVDLPTNLQDPARAQSVEEDGMVPLELMERRAIFRALQGTGGDKLAAARLLGIGKTTLYRKLKQYESHQSN